MNQKHGLRLSVRTVKAECEAVVGHPISSTTVYRIIRQQGWRPKQLSRKLPNLRAALDRAGVSLGAEDRRVLGNILGYPLP